MGPKPLAFSTVAIIASLFALAAFAQDATTVPPPIVTDVTLVTGTKAMYQVGTGVANLDAGNLVAGWMKWDKFGVGIYFNESFVSYLWDPTKGAVVIPESTTTWTTPHISFASAIAPNRTVVGTDAMRETYKSYAWLWNQTDGPQFLPTQCNGPNPPPHEFPTTDCTSSALAVSDDARIVAGAVYDDYMSPPQAARWIMKRTKQGLKATLDVLAPRGAGWSEANDVSADGMVIVGDSGPSDMNFHAARWTDRYFGQMQAVGDTSTAMFVAEDGGNAIGIANDGMQTVLVRWAADGTATRFDPPDGGTIVELNAINPAATAAVGAVSFNNNWAPFLWTEWGGYTILPELDEPAYDMSFASDVSDDGTVVVGMLGSSVYGPGSPLAYGFYWSERTGLVLVDDMLVGWQPDPPDYWSVSAISGDGLRLLANGNYPAGTHDAHTILVTLAPQ